MKKKSFVVFIFLMMFAGIAQAETGSISFTDTNEYEWQFSGVVAGITENFSRMKFYNSEFSTISVYNLSALSGTFYTSTQMSDVTAFTIISGGSGYGVVSYSTPNQYLRWVFAENTIINSSQVTLQYTSSSFWSNLTFINLRTSADDSLSASRPICITDNAFGDCLTASLATNWFNNKVDAGISVFLDYNVTYPFDNSFNINVNKYTDSADTKTIIHTQTTELNRESSFNDNDFNFFYEYSDKLFLNVTVSSGLYEDVLLNASTNVPATSGNIEYNKSSYNLFSDFNISYSISNKNNLYGYQWQMKNSDTQEIIQTKTISGTAGYDIVTNSQLIDKESVHYYEVCLREIQDLFTIRWLDCAQTFYGANQSEVNVSVTGNITAMNATVYPNQREYLRFNISTNGYVQITDLFDIIQSFSIWEGNDQEIVIYLPNNSKFGTYKASLYFYNHYTEWNELLDQDTFNVISANSTLYVDKENYDMGETVKIYANNNFWSSYVTILNPNSEMLLNYSLINSIYIQEINHYLPHTYAAGTYQVNLFSNGSQAKSVTSYVNQKYATPQPTATSNISVQEQSENYIESKCNTVSSFLDIGNCLSMIALGNMDENQDDEYSETEISHTFNKLFMTLLLIVFLILLFGITGKRK